jgi:hypothetical protein
MTQRDTNLRGISREWLAARIVLLGGFVLAIAVAAYFTLRPAPVVQQLPAAQTEDQAAAVLARKEANAKAAIMVCAMELLNAKNTGIVPSYGQLVGMLPRKTATRGRYACIAGTNVTHYVIEADLVCRNLLDSRCVALHEVKTSDGTLLYQRPNPAP